MVNHLLLHCKGYETETSKPKVMITVRLPVEFIEWKSLDEFDLLMGIKKLLPNSVEKYTNEWIEYNTLHQHLTYIFPKECHSVARVLNDRIFTEENEYYIQRKGEIGTKDCKIKINKDRPLISKELGKVLQVGKNKYKAITCYSREIDAECDSVEEAKQKLLNQINFDPNLNWHNKLYTAFQNFMETHQIFRSLEAELDCSDFSSLNDLYLLPTKVIDQLKGDRNDVTFSDFIIDYENNHPILKSAEGLCLIKSKNN